MSISIRELLDAGAHFGHQTHRWNPKMKPYIYGARNGIYIIDLEKTAALWKQARQAIVETVMAGSKVLIVGTKPQAQEIVREEAERAHQHYVNRRWLGGMLTNFKTIKGRIDRLEQLEKTKNSEQAQKLSKKELLTLEKEYVKLEKSLHGIKNMDRLPGLVIIVDPNKEYIAVSEARKLQIPIVAITDTNCDPDGIDHVIPANDDAIKSIRLFLSAATDACLEGMKAFERRIQEETRKRLEAEAKKQAAKGDKENGQQTIETKEVENSSSTRAEFMSIQPQGLGERS